MAEIRGQENVCVSLWYVKFGSKHLSSHICHLYLFVDIAPAVIVTSGKDTGALVVLKNVILSLDLN